jgi:hypothetical protein
MKPRDEQAALERDYRALVREQWREARVLRFNIKRPKPKRKPDAGRVDPAR